MAMKWGLLIANNSRSGNTKRKCVNKNVKCSQSVSWKCQHRRWFKTFYGPSNRVRIQQNLTNIINGSKANVLSNRGIGDYQLFIVKRCMDHRKRTSSEWVTPYVFQTSSSFHPRRWIYREPTNMAGGQYDDWQYGIWTTLITAGCRVGLITRLVGPLVLIMYIPAWDVVYLSYMVQLQTLQPIATQVSNESCATIGYKVCDNVISL